MKGSIDDPQPPYHQPSAPPVDSASSENVQPHHQVQHQLQQIQLESVTPLQAPPPTSGASASGSTDLPPPSYHEAIGGAYPTIPALVPGYAPYQPNTFPKAPGGDYQQYPPYPTHQHYNAVGGGAAPAANVYHPTTNVPLTTTHVIHQTTILPDAGCIHCVTGRVESETDLCCLLCLILLAIFTFPVGLILLCCIPCTVRKRCTRCRRLNA